MVSRPSFGSWKYNIYGFFNTDFCYICFNVLGPEEEPLQYSHKKGSYFLDEFLAVLKYYARIFTEALCGSHFPLMISGCFTVRL